jgi:hypothetical protein
MIDVTSDSFWHRLYRSGGGLWPLFFVWALFAVVAVEIVVTYARVPVGELYHVSETGFGGAFGRALVFVGFPTALAALPLLGIAVDCLLASGLSPAGRRAVVVVGLVALPLLLSVVWPGVVDQGDLDAKPINALAAVGVAITVGLTVAAARVSGRRARVWRWWPPALAALLVLLVLAIPWIAADLGFFLDGVPVLGSVFLTGELASQPGVPGLHAAVHHGHHHGLDGVLLTIAAVVLTGFLPGLASPRLRLAVGVCLGLMVAYGLANVLNDFWLEQVVKRGWTTFEFPNVLRPTLTVAWAAILVAAAVVSATLFARARPTSRPGPIEDTPLEKAH